MANISKVKLPGSNTIYNIVDTGARELIGNAMVFKGTLGTGGTITTLPAAATTNRGYTYKVITDGTYQSVAAKVGDTLISTGSKWELIPSGDEPSGTVTNINTGTGLTGGPITSSGTISVDTSVIATVVEMNKRIVAPTTAVANQVLTYNGSSWIAKTPETSGLVVDGHNLIITGSGTINQHSLYI